ncbi:hypothetical protein ACROYT_G009410 [Oculina patagonica]
MYGFTGTVLDWFRSYLNDRSQKVVIGNTESKPQPLTSGVPQGSVLGPQLFSLYFGPLQDVIKAHGLDCMMYADDSQLYIILNPAARQPALLNLELCINDIQAFFLTNKLVCNPTKTEVLHLTSRFTRHPPLSNISIGVNIVSCANKARNLGSVLDRHLTMTSHVNNICRHASLALRNIGRVRKYISQSSTERLVHAFITSKLDYCNSLLYGLPSTELQKLQRIQNTAARLVVKAKRTDHISPILQQLHWLPVSERISFKILLFTYKAMNGYAPSYIVDLLDQYAGQYPRLSDPNYLLLLDTRQRLDYNESHIITAKFAPRNDIGAFTVPFDAKLQTKEHVIVYDSNTSSIKDKNSTALSCAKLMWEMESKNPVKS